MSEWKEFFFFWKHWSFSEPSTGKRLRSGQVKGALIGESTRVARGRAWAQWLGVSQHWLYYFRNAHWPGQSPRVSQGSQKRLRPGTGDLSTGAPRLTENSSWNAPSIVLEITCFTWISSSNIENALSTFNHGFLLIIPVTKRLNCSCAPSKSCYQLCNALTGFGCQIQGPRERFTGRMRNTLIWLSIYEKLVLQRATWAEFS